MSEAGDVGWHFSLSEVTARLAPLSEGGGRFHYALRHGSMRTGLYAPDGIDTQTPHDQDELYVISAGKGYFVKDDVRVGVAAQDLVFVEAGADHRFEDLSPDFATWVIFWGPKGGE